MDDGQVEKENTGPPTLMEIDAGIATITLNRPRTINALSEEVLAGLQQTLDTVSSDRSVKAVIVRGAGNHFCSGHNIKEMTQRRADNDASWSRAAILPLPPILRGLPPPA
jgi:enoyl-CoA hydratase/carnithine racemase